MPRLVAAFLLITLSSIALPGLNGFVGEFLILVGAFQWSPKLTALAATGVILSAVYMLWMFQRVNYGPITNEKNRTLPDLTPREWALLVPTIAMAILMGVVPGHLPAADGAVGQPSDRAGDRQPAGAVDNRSGAGPCVPALGTPPTGTAEPSALRSDRERRTRTPNPERRPRTTNHERRSGPKQMSDYAAIIPIVIVVLVGAAPPCSPRRSASAASACRSPASA